MPGRRDGESWLEGRPVAVGERPPAAAPSALHLVPVVRDQRRIAVESALLAGVAAVLVVLVLDVPTREVLLGGLIASVVFAAGELLWERQHLVPGVPLAVPAHAEVLPRGAAGARLWLWLPLSLALLAGGTWLLDQFGLAPLLVGQIAGTGISAVITAFFVRRWERRHGRRVLAAVDRERTDRIYADVPDD